MASRISLHLSPPCLLLRPPQPPSSSSTLCSSLHLPLFSFIHLFPLITPLSSSLPLSPCLPLSATPRGGGGRWLKVELNPTLPLLWGHGGSALLTSELHLRGPEVVPNLIVLSVFVFVLTQMCLSVKLLFVTTTCYI